MSIVERYAVGAPCWADLWTSDVEGSRSFYSELLGWEAQEPSEEFGGYFMFHHNGRPIAGGMGDMGDMQADNRWKVYLSTADVAETAMQVDRDGGRTVMPPVPVADMGQQFVFDDPGGAHLGAWQPGTFAGFSAMGEPGAPSWFELITRNYDDSLAFYRSIFEWKTEVMSDAEAFRYTTVHDPTTAVEFAGVLDGSGYLPEGVGSHWLIYWDVADVDASVERLIGLGGTLTDGPQDTPYGRVAAVTDPCGAPFKLRRPPA